MLRYRDSLQKGDYYAGEPGYAPVTKRNADIDIDKDVDKDVDVDTEGEEEADAQESCSNGNSEDLAEVFVRQTRIPEFTGGVEKWEQALERLKQSGVEGRDG